MPTAQPPPGARPTARSTVTLDDLITHPEADELHRASCLYLGFEKTGKSTCVLSYPRPFVIQTDPNAGVLEAAGHPSVRLDRIAEQEGRAAAWDIFEHTILPAIVNREIDADSIVIDSDVFLYEMMQAAIPTPTSSKGQPDTFKYWDSVKKTAHGTHAALVGATGPFYGDSSRRRYHLAVACHLQELTNDEGGVIGFRPGLQGSFKNEIGRLFKTVLYCDTDRETTPQPGGAAQVRIRYFCHTRPPNRWVKCGDSMGAPGGRWQPLPDKVDGTFAGLTKAWGFPAPSKE